jgi:hypothetical protein
MLLVRAEDITADKRSHCSPTIRRRSAGVRRGEHGDNFPVPILVRDYEATARSPWRERKGMNVVPLLEDKKEAVRVRASAGYLAA